jgi:ribosomal protein S18 acetylase RimI-like enzyme
MYKNEHGKMIIKKVTIFTERVYEAVLRLLPQLTQVDELPGKQYLKEIIEAENVHFFTAESADNEIIGMLTIGTYKTPTGIKAWIEDVVVDESQRGNGFGEELMLFAIDYSKTLGAKSIGLTSRKSRIAANRLYKKIGFIQYETNVYKYLLS